MAKKKCPECPAGEKWAVPYADFLSLLLALFIALYAISAVNTSKVEALKTELIKVFDFPESKAVKESAKTSDSPSHFQGRSATLKNDGESISTKKNKNNERYNVALDQAENQVAIDLPAAVEFSLLSAEISNPDMINFIRIVSMIINKLPDSVTIEIRGFADDYGEFVNDYKLGGDRAFNVLKMLVEYGIDQKRLRYSSFGGNSQSKDMTNLKVAKVYFRVDIDDKKVQQSVLDVISQME